MMVVIYRNACRYCEGYCSVFPAMELRRSFTSGDLSYLANLCHDCRGCYYACQYAPPHEFALNLPQALAQVRMDGYMEYAWPKLLAGLFKRNGMIVSVVASISIAFVLLATISLRSSEFLYRPNSAPGSFYRVIPEAVMLSMALVTLGYSVLALTVGCRKFWRHTGGDSVVTAHAVLQAFSDVVTLRNLGGSGHGCNDLDESFSQTRRYSHQAMLYGFLLCIGSTTSAAFYEHILGRLAPYPLVSIPVMLGTVGGLGMLIGTAGLLLVKVKSDPAPVAKALLGADYALLALLFLASATGLLLLVMRDASTMGILLALHLGVILSFFLTLPYTKFVHGIYRSAALLHHAAERKAS